MLAAVFAPLISPQNPYDLAQLDVLDSRLPPGARSGNGLTFWLGSDGQGRDILSGIFYGLRISLTVGVGSTLVRARHRPRARPVRRLFRRAHRQR